MACTRERPCGNYLRTTLVTFDAIISECLNAHTFRTERLDKPRVIQREIVARKYRPSTRNCEHCHTRMEPGRQMNARVHIRCRDAFKYAKVRAQSRREHRRVS